MVLIVGSTSTGTGIRYDLAAADNMFVLNNANIVSTDNAAIRGLGGNHTVTVSGHVYGEGRDGISLGNTLATDSNNRVVVNAGGYVGGDDDAISLTGSDTHVENYGSLSGNYGINIYGPSGSNSTIINAGTISAKYGAIYSGGNANITLLNTGSINGSGSGSAYTSNGSGVDTITNRGLMTGAITLGMGNDVYDGRLGSALGQLSGGEGNDRFRLGAGEEKVDGGTESDSVDYRSSTGVTLALDGSLANSGMASGDSFVNVESFFGSATGADVMVGDALANVFYGGGGNDVLSGNAGNDALVGGLGTDRLTGGLGNDAFVFASPAHGADVINDFTNLTGNNDIIRISAAGFGAGLVAGPLNAAYFRSQTTNVAGDSNDRFIFRSTDKTLWFDANGTGAGGLTLLADLQASATLTAADIILI